MAFLKHLPGFEFVGGNLTDDTNSVPDFGFSAKLDVDRLAVGFPLARLFHPIFFPKVVFGARSAVRICHLHSGNSLGADFHQGTVGGDLLMSGCRFFEGEPLITPTRGEENSEGGDDGGGGFGCVAHGKI
jgi:hypothetical protein